MAERRLPALQAFSLLFQGMFLAATPLRCRLTHDKLLDWRQDAGAIYSHLGP